MRMLGKIVPDAPTAMTDLIYIAVTLTFFASSAFYVRFCESL